MQFNILLHKNAQNQLILCGTMPLLYTESSLKALLYHSQKEKLNQYFFFSPKAFFT